MTHLRYLISRVMFLCSKFAPRPWVSTWYANHISIVMHSNVISTYRAVVALIGFLKRRSGIENKILNGLLSHDVIKVSAQILFPPIMFTVESWVIFLPRT